MASSKNLEYKKVSFLNKANSAFIEQMYLKFINEDSDLPESWKNYFDTIDEDLNIVVNEINGPSWNYKKSISLDKIQKRIEKEEIDSSIVKNTNDINKKDLLKSNSESMKAVALIRSYRLRGHLIANLDPLGLMESEYLDELHPEFYGFKKEDYQKKIYLDGAINKQYSNIREILNFLKKTYFCRIGYE